MTAEKSAPSERKIALSGRRAAIHEAGHVIVAWHSPRIWGINVKIYKRKRQWNGYTSTMVAMTMPGVWDGLSVLLAGIAAEIIWFGNAHRAGSARDLALATILGFALLGHNPKNPTRTCQWKKGGRKYTPKFDELGGPPLPKVIEDIFKVAYNRAVSLIRQNRTAFNAVAEELFHKRRLSEASLTRLLDKRTWLMQIPKKAE